MHLFRFRYVIQATEDIPPLPSVPLGMAHAVLCEVYGKGRGEQSGLPDHKVMVHAPEQLRIRLNRGEQYAFGITFIGDSITEGRAFSGAIRRGLRRHGSDPRNVKDTLSGNFELISVEDLFAGQPLVEGNDPVPLDGQHVLRECQQLMGSSPVVTLDFITPLRWWLDENRKLYFDRRNFDAGRFLEKIGDRLQQCGIDAGPCCSKAELDQATVVENRLVWLDCSYRSGRAKHFALSGAKGSIAIKLPPEFPVHWLVWSQYLHLGKSTKFGLGAFRIQELGPDPFACHRTSSLVKLSFQASRLELQALQSDTSPDAVREAVALIDSGKYTPRAPICFSLETPNKESRPLTIPQPVDRALQRCVLEVLGPGLDDLFEKSSFAFRRGLGRYRAAQEIEKAWKYGFRWAVQADFERFFDSIRQSDLLDRLRAYSADEHVTSLVAQWISSAAASGVGLPTGAPLSPLLANLFLDRFDELVRQDGGWLVRYSDDFLILTRTEEAANTLFERAALLADEMLLSLNDAKHRIIDLREPFQFLGFSFQRETHWQATPDQAPIEIERLGWRDASRDRPDFAPRFLLCGETYSSALLCGTTCLIEEDVEWIGIDNGCLVIETANGARRKGAAISSIDQILAPKCISLDASLLKAAHQNQVTLMMTDAAGNSLLELFPDASMFHTELISAQLTATQDDAFRLWFARQIVSCKLQNYAGLAAAIPSREEENRTEAKLRQFAEAALNAQSLEQLLGIEGAGAACWYASLPFRLPTRFGFPGRIAPRARDPVNVLLNMSHTALYRQVRVCLRLQGLEPALGIMHRPSPGHAALASDVQEVFRMLAERAAIETLWKSRPADFRHDEHGQYPLVASSGVRKRLFQTLTQSLSQSAIGECVEEQYTLRNHILRLARSLKTRLLQGEGELRLYRVPAEIATQD